MRNDELDKMLKAAVDAAAGPRREVQGALGSLSGLLTPTAQETAGVSESGPRVESALGLISLTPSAGKESGTAKVASWINPLLGGLLELFGGGDPAPQIVLPKAERPGRRNYVAGFEGEDGPLVEFDRDEQGRVREAAPVAGPSIVVNVEAMDSRSFLDRTPEIAEAVKRALLESDGLKSALDEY